MADPILVNPKNVMDFKVVLSETELPIFEGKKLRYRTVTYSGYAEFALNDAHSKIRGDADDDGLWVLYEIVFKVGDTKWQSILNAAPMLAPAGWRLDDSDETDDTGFRFAHWWANTDADAEENVPRRLELHATLNMRGGRTSSLTVVAFTVTMTGLEQLK